MSIKTDNVVKPGKSCSDIKHALEINSVTKILKEDESTKEYKNGHTSLDFSQIDINSPGQKCFGEKSDVERLLDSRCPCLRSSKCLHLSGTLIFFAVTGFCLVFFFRRYLKELLVWLQYADGRLSGLLFILMFTIVSFPMTWGYIVLNVAAGYLYGFFMGVTTVAVSVIIGVTVSLVVCRRFIRGFVHSKLQSDHLRAIVRVVESRRGFKVVFLTRLTPIPFGLQNGLFAITNMNISKCLLASFIGLLPTQALNAYIGSSLRTMEDVMHHHSAGGYAILAVQVGISAFLMWYVIRRARYELNKACIPTEYERTLDDLCTPISKHSLLNRTFTSISSNGYQPVPTTDDIDNIVVKKQGHKRAHSASAVLYALQQKNQSDKD